MSVHLPFPTPYLPHLSSSILLVSLLLYFPSHHPPNPFPPPSSSPPPLPPPGSLLNPLPRLPLLPSSFPLLSPSPFFFSSSFLYPPSSSRGPKEADDFAAEKGFKYSATYKWQKPSKMWPLTNYMIALCIQNWVDSIFFWCIDIFSVHLINYFNSLTPYPKMRQIPGQWGFIHFNLQCGFDWKRARGRVGYQKFHTEMLGRL